MWKCLNVKYLLLLSDFDKTWNFSTDFQKKTDKLSNFIKTRPVGVELFHADRRRDRRADGYYEANTVEPLITDTAGEFKFCPL